MQSTEVAARFPADTAGCGHDTRPTEAARRSSAYGDGPSSPAIIVRFGELHARRLGRTQTSFLRNVHRLAQPVRAERDAVAATRRRFARALTRDSDLDDGPRRRSQRWCHAAG